MSNGLGYKEVMKKWEESSHYTEPTELQIPIGYGESTDDGEMIVDFVPLKNNIIAICGGTGSGKSALRTTSLLYLCEKFKGDVEMVYTEGYRDLDVLESLESGTCLEYQFNRDYIDCMNRISEVKDTICDRQSKRKESDVACNEDCISKPAEWVLDENPMKPRVVFIQELLPKIEQSVLDMEYVCNTIVECLQEGPSVGVYFVIDQPMENFIMGNLPQSKWPVCTYLECINDGGEYRVNYLSPNPTHKALSYNTIKPVSDDENLVDLFNSILAED